MKQSRDVPWAVMVEENDTEESVARWLEQHCVTTDGMIMRPGDIRVDQWEITPKPGDVILTNTPPPLATLRFGGFIVVHDELQEQIANNVFDETFWERVVNTLTRRRKDV